MHPLRFPINYFPATSSALARLTAAPFFLPYCSPRCCRPLLLPLLLCWQHRHCCQASPLPPVSSRRYHPSLPSLLPPQPSPLLQQFPCHLLYHCPVAILHLLPIASVVASSAFSPIPTIVATPLINHNRCPLLQPPLLPVVSHLFIFNARHLSVAAHTISFTTA
ncbi:hypothetical protein BHE74_00029342 [Ensete ventricosum]|nr:hypothetical protein GW17_00031862 [Ensete ventricosum]RWW63474.1 hypothetical protein BHE74_00029342 [Ensete ventricosum]